MNAPWMAVFRAEWLSALRDKRALMSALIFPLVGPLLVGVLFTSVAKNFSAESKVTIHIDGAQYAPGFVSWVARSGVDAEPVTTERRVKLVAQGTAVLVVDPSYASRLQQGKVAQMRLVADFAKPKTAAEAHRIRALVQGYAAQIVTMRLVLRGVSPTTLRAVELQEDDLATPQHHAANVLHVVPLFVILACFIGGMQVAIDVTAGERERGSLEALLVSPVSTNEIALGKWLVTMLFGAISAALTLALSIVSLSWTPLESLGIHGG
ncbi:MAG TPA: hypothetical protein DCQ06_06585, partial [Myxococcales bacterium]|nr:hypothetical protein [Myxococcales bacterium]